MEITNLELGCQKARDIHLDIVQGKRSYSLTVTLNPHWQMLPMNEQHDNLKREVKGIFSQMVEFYDVAMITPEFTENYDIHFHCYFKLREGVEIITFDQNFKKCRCKTKYTGRNYKLKYVDNPTERIINYPFKDNNKVIHYSQIKNCMFKPSHTVYKSLYTHFKPTKTVPTPVKDEHIKILKKQLVKTKIEELFEIIDKNI